MALSERGPTMRDGAPTVRLILIVVTLQFAAFLTGYPTHVVDAAQFCGCHLDSSPRWTCDLKCSPQSCRDAGQWFPDRESCLRRSIAPVKSAKSESAPSSKKKVAQITASKKPASSGANSLKTTSIQTPSPKKQVVKLAQ